MKAFAIMRQPTTYHQMKERKIKMTKVLKDGIIMKNVEWFGGDYMNEENVVIERRY